MEHVLIPSFCEWECGTLLIGTELSVLDSCLTTSLLLELEGITFSLIQDSSHSRSVEEEASIKESEFRNKEQFQMNTTKEHTLSF